MIYKINLVFNFFDFNILETLKLKHYYFNVTLNVIDYFQIYFVLSLSSTILCIKIFTSYYIL